VLVDSLKYHRLSALPTFFINGEWRLLATWNTRHKPAQTTQTNRPGIERMNISETSALARQRTKLDRLEACDDISVSQLCSVDNKEHRDWSVAGIETDHLISIPAEFLCPITLEKMEFPMRSPYGHVFERADIRKWLSFSLEQTGHSTCPLTRRNLRYCELSPDYRLLSQIYLWQAEHGKIISTQETWTLEELHQFYYVPRLSLAEFTKRRNYELMQLLKEYEESIGMTAERYSQGDGYSTS
jgi:U-box domain